MEKVQITSSGIKKALRKYDPIKSISEYVWNGFDAGATQVEIEADTNDLGHISELRIRDNGTGIEREKLDTKFMPVFESDRTIDPNAQRPVSAYHGKNGIGRLTFFKFALMANWQTTFHSDISFTRYHITVSSDTLNTYTASEPTTVAGPEGTIVSFTGVHAITSDQLHTDIKSYLLREFAWFLELNSMRQFSIIVGGEKLDSTSVMRDQDQYGFSIADASFDIRYVQWACQMNREYSHCYYIDSQGKEQYKATTTLNNKGDHFFHSVFITSPYFDDFLPPSSSQDSVDQLVFFRDDTVKALDQEVDSLLRSKRKPFLVTYSDRLIADFEKDGAFPSFGDNGWDRYRKSELESLVRQLYQVEPRLFTNLNLEQKKTFVHFLNLIMDTGERDKLFEVLSAIVHLDHCEREQLADLLRSSRLSNVISTIKIIEDRFRVLATLKRLVFEPDLKANERDHLQPEIERHYWIFGEQYHLVTAAEPKFEEALRRFIHILRGQKKTVQITHPDKNKEMDIFMVRQFAGTDKVKSVVVELKSPWVLLGETELAQVKRYMQVILHQPEFNGDAFEWEFHLIGNRFDTSGYIEGELKNAKSHGENSLVYSVDKYKIYARKWSDVFAEVELRHKFLFDKLSIERSRLASEGNTASEVLKSIETSSAIQPGPVTVP